jgi:hypothetical protein
VDETGSESYPVAILDIKVIKISGYPARELFTSYGNGAVKLESGLELSQDRAQWRALVLTAWNLLV